MRTFARTDVPRRHRSTLPERPVLHPRTLVYPARPFVSFLGAAIKTPTTLFVDPPPPTFLLHCFLSSRCDHRSNFTSPPSSLYYTALCFYPFFLFFFSSFFPPIECSKPNANSSGEKERERERGRMNIRSELFPRVYVRFDDRWEKLVEEENRINRIPSFSISCATYFRLIT